MAGVQTTAGNIAGLFVDINATSPTGNFTVDTTPFNTGINGSIFFGAIWVLFAVYIGATVIRAGLGGTQGIAETIKVNLAWALVPVLISDFVALMSYANGLTGAGEIIKLIAVVIYLPISIGAIISITDWIGGGK